VRLRKCAMKREEIIAAGGVHADTGIVIGFLGIVSAVLGVVSDAMNITLGLEPTSWLLLAIFAGLISISNYIAWAIAMHLDAIEAKSKKEE
jgi:hypothetical protein